MLHPNSALEQVCAPVDLNSHWKRQAQDHTWQRLLQALRNPSTPWARPLNGSLIVRNRSRSQAQVAIAQSTEAQRRRMQRGKSAPNNVVIWRLRRCKPSKQLRDSTSQTIKRWRIKQRHGESALRHVAQWRKRDTKSTQAQEPTIYPRISPMDLKFTCMRRQTQWIRMWKRVCQAQVTMNCKINQTCNTWISQLSQSVLAKGLRWLLVVVIHITNQVLAAITRAATVR